MPGGKIFVQILLNFYLKNFDEILKFLILKFRNTQPHVLKRAINSEQRLLHTLLNSKYMMLVSNLHVFPGHLSRLKSTRWAPDM